ARVVGTVTHGASEPRQVTADNCADVIAALALITALTIDPKAVIGDVGATTSADAQPDAALGSRASNSSPQSSSAPSAASDRTTADGDAASGPLRPGRGTRPKEAQKPDQADESANSREARSDSGTSPRYRQVVGLLARLDVTRGLGAGTISFLGASV